MEQNFTVGHPCHFLDSTPLQFGENTIKNLFKSHYHDFLLRHAISRIPNIFEDLARSIERITVLLKKYLMEAKDYSSRQRKSLPIEGKSLQDATGKDHRPINEVLYFIEQKLTSNHKTL